MGAAIAVAAYLTYVDQAKEVYRGTGRGGPVPTNRVAIADGVVCLIIAFGFCIKLVTAVRASGTGRDQILSRKVLGPAIIAAALAILGVAGILGGLAGWFV